MWAGADPTPVANRTAADLLTRRKVLGVALATLGAMAAAKAVERASQGLVLPRVPAPNLALTDTLGRPLGLAAALRGGWLIEPSSCLRRNTSPNCWPSLLRHDR